MSTIRDGATGIGAKVLKDGELLVRAVTEDDIEHVSETAGQAYAWVSQNLDIDAADTLLLLHNTADTNLHINRLIISAGNAITRYEIHIITDATTPVGGAITGFNLNTGSSNVADALAKSDETANSSQGTVIYDISLLARTTLVVETSGLILAKNVAIGVDQVSESDSGNVTIIGHYEE